MRYTRTLRHAIQSVSSDALNSAAAKVSELGAGRVSSTDISSPKGSVESLSVGRVKAQEMETTGFASHGLSQGVKTIGLMAKRTAAAPRTVVKSVDDVRGRFAAFNRKRQYMSGDLDINAVIRAGREKRALESAGVKLSKVDSDKLLTRVIKEGNYKSSKGSSS